MWGGRFATSVKQKFENAENALAQRHAAGGVNERGLCGEQGAWRARVEGCSMWRLMWRGRSNAAQRRGGPGGAGG
jgi:hypothetical protein